MKFKVLPIMALPFGARKRKPFLALITDCNLQPILQFGAIKSNCINNLVAPINLNKLNRNEIKWTSTHLLAYIGD